MSIRKSGSNAQPINHQRSGFEDENVDPNCANAASVIERLGGLA
jgi:hypothetical protein